MSNSGQDTAFLAIDSGNTLVKAGLFVDGALQQKHSAARNDVPALVHHLATLPWHAALIADTGGIGADLCSGLANAVAGRSVRLLTADIPLPIRLGYDTPATLGPDRIACAVGAWQHWPGCNILVADAGTALTLDLVLATGEMPGGNISAGMTMRLQALHAHTSRLPMVAVQHDVDVPVVGHDTPSALMAGAVLGMAHEIDGQFALLARLLGQLKPVLTGGDAPLIAPYLSTQSVAHLPDLCLEGLNCILSTNLSEI